MKLFILPFFASVLCLPFIFAQEKKQKIDPATLEHPVKACLFKVEGNALEKPSWLFGTIHLGHKNVVNLHPRAQKAFNQSDAVYTEIDMNIETQMALLPLLARTDGKKLSEAIGPELTAQINTELKLINPFLSVTGFETMKTWFLAVSLPILDMQIKQKQPLDMVLYQKALKNGKTVGALEEARSQIDLFDQFSEEEMQSMLSETLKQMQDDRKNGTNSIEELLNKYLTLDVYGIGNYVNNEIATMEGDEDFKKRFMYALLDKRNIGMADKADDFMQKAKDKSHFFAVGAAHYTGEKSVQDLLTEKGYTITEAFE